MIGRRGLTPTFDGVVFAFSKAVELANYGGADAAAGFRKSLKSGSPFFTFEIDRIATTANEMVVIYKPSDALLGYLATFGARDSGHGMVKAYAYNGSDERVR